MMVTSAQGASPWQVAPLPTVDPTGDDRSDRTNNTDNPDQDNQNDQRERGPLVSPAAAAPRGRLTPRVVIRASADRGGASDGGRTMFTWVGAHGGAGENSLARASGMGLTVTGRWPDPALGWPAAVAIVTRSNGAGLDAAARMIQEVLSATVPDLELCALVVVADAPGRLPKPLRTRVHELSGTVPAVIRVEWIDEWRVSPYNPHPTATTAADELMSAVNALSPGSPVITAGDSHSTPTPTPGT